MLQDNEIRLLLPPPPTFAEAVRFIVLGWLAGLLFIAFGTRFVYSNKKLWLKVLAAVALALGFFWCFFLGFPFTPLARHHLIAWVEDDPTLNYWIDLCLGFAIWISGLLVFWAIKKRRQLQISRTTLDAN